MTALEAGPRSTVIVDGARGVVDLHAITAGDVMRAPAAAVDPSADLTDVAALMSALQLPCVLVKQAADAVAMDIARTFGG